MTELKNSNYNIVLGPSPSRAIILDAHSGIVHSNPPSPWTTELNYSVSAVAQSSPTSAERTRFSKPIKTPNTLDEQQPAVGVSEAYLELERHFQLNPIHFAKWWKASVPEKPRIGDRQPKPPTLTPPDTTVSSRRGILKGEKLQQQQQIQSPPPVAASPTLPDLNAQYVRDSLDLPTHGGRASFDSYSSSGQESCLSEGGSSLSRKTVRFAGEDGHLNHHALQQQQPAQQQQSPNSPSNGPPSLGNSGSEDSTCTLMPSPTRVHKSAADIGHSYIDGSRGPTMRPAIRRGGAGFPDPYEAETPQPVPRLLRPITTLHSEAKPPRPPKLTKDMHQHRARRKTTDLAELRSVSGAGYLRLHDQRRHQRGNTLDSPLYSTSSRSTAQTKEWDDVDSRVNLQDDSYANVGSFHLAYQPNNWFRHENDAPTPVSTTTAESEHASFRADSSLSSNRPRLFRPPRVERIDSSKLDDIARQLTSPTLMLDAPSFSHLSTERVTSPAFMEPTNGTSSTPTVSVVDENHRCPLDPISDNLKSQHNGFLESGPGGRMSEQASPGTHFIHTSQPRQSQPPVQTPAEPAVRIVPVQVVQDSSTPSRSANTVVAAPADSTVLPEANRPKLLPRRGSLTRGRPLVRPPQPTPRVRRGTLADSGWSLVTSPSPLPQSRSPTTVLPSIHTPAYISPEQARSGRSVSGTVRGASSDARRPTGRLDRDGVWRPIGDSDESRSRRSTAVLSRPRRTLSPPPRSPYDSLDLFLAHERDLQSPATIPSSLLGSPSRRI